MSGSRIQKEPEAQKVLDTRIRNGKNEYLIMWKGFKKNNSWEFEESLDCEALMKEFKDKFKNSFQSQFLDFIKVHGRIEII